MTIPLLVESNPVVVKHAVVKNEPNPKNKIRGCDGKYFIELVEEATGHKMDELVSQMKPTDWRDFIVRAVCMSKGGVGNQIRFMWTKMYKVTFLIFIF